MTGAGLPVPAPDGAAVQQQVIASVPHAPTPHGDYRVHVGLTHVLPGGRTEEIRHDVPEVVVVLRGELGLIRDGTRSTVRAGESFVIPPGSWHQFTNEGGAEGTMLFAFGGDPSTVTSRRNPAEPDQRPS